jgi:hypothetical protein
MRKEKKYYEIRWSFVLPTVDGPRTHFNTRYAGTEKRSAVAEASGIWNTVIRNRGVEWLSTPTVHKMIGTKSVGHLQIVKNSNPVMSEGWAG